MAEKVLRIWVVVKESFVKGIGKETLYREVVHNKAVRITVEEQPKIGGSDQHHADAVLAQPRNVHVLVVGIIVAVPLGVESFIVPDQSEQEYEIRDDGK